MLQATHMLGNTGEVRKEYMWYFSGANTAETGEVYHGIAIVIRNTFKNYIRDIEPVNEWLMCVADAWAHHSRYIQKRILVHSSL